MKQFRQPSTGRWIARAPLAQQRIGAVVSHLAAIT
jgi:hypothetical protein